MALLHSPLTRPLVWGGLAGALADRGITAFVADVADDDEPPFAARYVAAVARQIAAAAPEAPMLLLGHSGAGPLLPQVGFARRAAHRPPVGYVFLDAALPRPGPPASRLDLLEAEAPDAAVGLRRLLGGGGRFPDWTPDDLADDLPDPPARLVVTAALRPRGLPFFTEPLPFPGDWPDAPVGYLRTSAAYQSAARGAERRGWTVREHEAGHFAALADPGGTADALVELLAAMGLNGAYLGRPADGRIARTGDAGRRPAGPC